MANIIRKLYELYVLKAHVNHEGATCKQDFWADTLNKRFSFPTMDCCRRTSLQDFPQRGSKSLLLSLTAEMQQPCLGRTELLGTVCTTITLSPAPPQQKAPNKRDQEKKKRLLLCHHLYFICKMKKTVTSHQCKMTEGQQGDLQHYRHYHNLLNSNHWLPTIQQKNSGRKVKINCNKWKYVYK